MAVRRPLSFILLQLCGWAQRFAIVPRKEAPRRRETWSGCWPSGGDPGFKESNPAPYDCEDCIAEQSAKETYRTKKLELLERLICEVSLMRGKVTAARPPANSDQRQPSFGRQPFARDAHH